MPPVEIRAEIREAHDRIADEYGSYRSGIRPGSYDEWSRQLLARVVKGAFDRCVTEPGTVRLLDAGCGNGQFSVMFAGWGVGEIVGADFAPRMLDTARARMQALGFGDRFRGVCTDLEQLSLPVGSFDLVYLYGVVEHLDHPERVLAELARAVRPGGHLLVTFPRRGSLTHLTYLLFGLSPRDWGRAGRFNLRRRLDFAGKARLYRYFSDRRVRALCASVPGCRVAQRAPMAFNYLVGPPMYPLLLLGRLLGPAVFSLANALLSLFYRIPAGELVVLQKEDPS